MTSPLLTDPRLIVGLDLPSVEGARDMVRTLQGSRADTGKTGA